MNQYSTIVARLPPVEIVPAAATLTTAAVPPPPSPVASPSTEVAASSSASAVLATVKQPSEVQIEDLGSDDDSVTKLKKEPLPSTSKAFLITPDQQQQSPSTSSSSVRHSEDSEMSELRRRRLEKFGAASSGAN